MINPTYKIVGAGLFWLAVANAPALQAQPSSTTPVALDPLVVTVHPSGADERAAAVWVVTPNPSAVWSTHVVDLLLGVPGISINQPGGAGGLATLFMRGAEDNYTVIFLDGIPLNDPTNSRGGAVDLSLLDASVLRSAAVVRGAASVRYGPEALAGVVHFGSEAASTNETRLIAEAGGDHFQHGTVTVDRVFQKGTSSLQLDAAASTEGSLAEGSRARRQFFRGAFAQKIGDTTLRVSLWHIFHEADAFPDSSGGDLFAVSRDLTHRRDEQTAEAVRADGKAGAGRWQAGVDAAQINAVDRAAAVAPGMGNPGGLPVIVDDTKFRRTRANLEYTLPIDQWELTAGADAQREEGSDQSSLQYGPVVIPSSFSATRSRVGVFAEASGKLSAVSLIAGVRGDRYDNGLARATLRAGLLGPLGSTTQWRINAGTGFKPPSFYALSNPLVGSPSLKPERSRTVDFGLRQTLPEGRGLLDVSVFSSQFLDGIDFDPGPPPRLVNRAEIRSKGAELALTLKPLPSVTVQGSLSYADARSEPTGERLLSRPRWRAGLATTWAVCKDVALSAALTSLGDVADNSVPTGDVLLGGWSRLDLAVLWRVRPHLELSGRLENALDRRYQEAVGFFAQGLRFQGGLRWSF